MKNKYLLNLESRRIVATESILRLNTEIECITEKKKLIRIDRSKRNYQYSSEFRCWKDLDSKQRCIDNKINNIKFDTISVRSLVNSVIPETIKSYTTAVKGWHDYSDGKQVTAGCVKVKGSQYKEKVSTIKELLIDAGYIIRKEDAIHNSLMGTYFYLYYEPID